MPSIDISRYEKKKAAKKAGTNGQAGLTELLNRDISFGSRELSDKKKEQLYLELSSLLKAGVDLKTSFELITADQPKEKDKALFNKIQQTVLDGSTLSQA